MNSLFSFPKPASKKAESIDSLKIYIGEELRKFKTLPLKYGEKHEAWEAIKSLWEYTDVCRTFGGEGNLDRLYLMLTIQSAREKTLVLKRKIQSFENIKKIATTKPEDKDYIWSLQTSADTNTNNTFENSEALENYIHNIFKARQNNTEEISGMEDILPVQYDAKTETTKAQNIKKQPKQSKSLETDKFLKAGRLMKYDEDTKSFIDYEVQLLQNQIAYYKADEKEPNPKKTSLLGLKAEKSDFFPNEKHVFMINLPDSHIRIKSKTQKDMDEWITAINNQARINLENHNVDRKDDDINNLEYRFEKQTNEKLESLIKPHDIHNFSHREDLENFKRIMSKQPCRSLLFKSLAENNNYFSGSEKILDIIFVLKDEQVRSKWLQWLESLHMLIVNAVREPQNNGKDKFIGPDLKRMSMELAKCKGAIETFQSSYEEIRFEFTDKLKNKIMVNVEAILDALLDNFRGQYFDLIKKNPTFQRDLLDIMKAPFFQANQFKKSIQFDKRDKELVHSHSSTI